MKALVEAGKTPLEIRDKQGATPLYIAASSDQQQICLYLLSKRADVEVHLLPLQELLTLLCIQSALMISHTGALGANRAACTRQPYEGSALQGCHDVISCDEPLCWWPVWMPTVVLGHPIVVLQTSLMCLYLQSCNSIM